MSEIENLSAEVVSAATKAGVTIATAESLTAGLVAAAIADTPGASAVLRGGLIVYATELKAELAGVDQELLEHHGPVDPEVAWELAAGARKRCGASIGVGLTGVAGPDSQGGHPVGNVFIALDAPGELGGAQVHRFEFGAVGRAAVRQASVKAALELIAGVLPLPGTN